MGLSLSEKETHLNMTGDNRGQWAVFSDDSILQARIEKVGVKPSRIDGEGRYYVLDASQVRFYRQKHYSQAERRKRAERLQSPATAGG